MTKISPQASTHDWTLSAEPTNMTPASPAQAGATELMSKPGPDACMSDDAPPEQAADSPAARMLRQQLAARVAENARRTGADGTGQADGPPRRPDPTTAASEQEKRVAEEACKAVASAVGTEIGKAFRSRLGPFGGTIGGVIGSIAGSLLCKPSADGDPGAAGAGSTNPSERGRR